jgi:hypothetical protein
MRKFISTLVFAQATSAFIVHPTSGGNSRITILGSSSSAENEFDVSDLGLTMDDLNAPLPSDFLQGIATTGYDSTSRISNVQDDGCMWTETPDRMKATLKIPGIRGQPAMCLSVLTSTNTLSLTAFGRVVWSCILRGEANPETAIFEAKEGTDMIPIIEYEVQKADPNERWGGFILQIGEDSIL